MKKLPDAQVASFIKNGTLRCHDDNGKLLNGGIIFLSERDLKKITDFPKDLRRPIENENNEIQYLAPDSIWLFSSYEIIKHKKLFVSWLKAASIYHADPASYEKKERMLKIGKTLLSLVYDYYQDTSLLSKQLWNNLNFSYGDKVALHSNTFSSLFESIEDIIEFEKILPDEFKPIHTRTRRNLDNNIMYYTYLKAVIKFAEDYTLSAVPLMIRSRLQHSSSETCYMEILNILRKYKFSAIEDMVRKLFNTSSKTKVVARAREILIENKALTPQTQTIISEDDFTVYHKVITVNFLALKEKTHDNLFVTHTLVNLMYIYLGLHFSLFKKTSTTTVDFEIRTQEKTEIEVFKKMLNQCITYTFDSFLNTEIFDKFSLSKKGSRIAHENNKSIQNDFKIGFEAFCRQEGLQNMLPLKHEKEKTQKI